MSNEQEEVIEILGRQIPISYWSIAKQMSALWPDGEGFTLTHRLALAFAAGVEHAKNYYPQVESEINQAIRDADELSDRLRNIRRNL